MLKKRIITALCLAPLAIVALFLPNWAFCIVIGLTTLLAGWEYALLINISSQRNQIIYVTGLAALYGMGLYLPLVFLFIGTAWWVAASIFIIKFPLGQKQWIDWRWLSPLVGYLMICPAAVGLNMLHHLPHGWSWILLLLLIVWAADIGAYFVGKYLGKQPLAPLISPKKTIQGLCGGLVAVIIVTGIYAYVWHFSFFSEPFFMILILLIFMLAVIGDLVESAVKRWMNVKDSGTLLPGHGGILDRIDSLLATSPVFALGVVLLLGNIR